MSRLVTKPSFRYFAHWKSDVRQRWQVFTILKTNAATIFFLATLPVVLRTVLGSAISANCASKTERHAVSSEGWLGCHVGHWSFGGSCLAKSLSMPSTFCQWLVFQLSLKAWGQLRRESGKTLFAGVTPDSIWCPDVCQQSSKLDAKMKQRASVAWRVACKIMRQRASVAWRVACKMMRQRASVAWRVAWKMMRQRASVAWHVACKMMRQRASVT